MNKYDIAGILRTYSEQISKCKSTKHIKELLKRLKKELDLRKVTDNEDD